MHDALGALRERASLWLNLAAAVVTGALCAQELITTPPRGTALTVVMIAASVLGCGALAIRERYPVALSIAIGAAFFVPGVVAGARWWNVLPPALLVPCVLFAYTVAASASGRAAVLGLIAVILAMSAGDLSDPVAMLVFTVPAWVVGKVMQSRNRLTAQLEARAQELEQEQEAFAREAVRYERARIARDLHDVVAHSLSMIVVQAGAGRRALASDPATAAESLRNIAGGAHQAELEIEQLVGLLGEDDRRAERLGRLDELVRQAAATGLSVSYRTSGAHDDVPAEFAQAGYHVAQEGITNALKHAPGAPIEIALVAAARSLSIAVENGPPAAAQSGLERAGGAYGIAGLRERLRALGGSLQAGPTAAGGWRLEAEMRSSADAALR